LATRLRLRRQSSWARPLSPTNRDPKISDLESRKVVLLKNSLIKSTNFKLSNRALNWVFLTRKVFNFLPFSQLPLNKKYSEFQALAFLILFLSNYCLSQIWFQLWCKNM
jgi:hypothetical protein